MKAETNIEKNFIPISSIKNSPMHQIPPCNASQTPHITKVIFLLYFKFDEYMPEMACATRTNNCSIKTDIVTIITPPVHRTEEARTLLLFHCVHLEEEEAFCCC